MKKRQGFAGSKCPVSPVSIVWLTGQSVHSRQLLTLLFSLVPSEYLFCSSLYLSDLLLSAAEELPQSPF